MNVKIILASAALFAAQTVFAASQAPTSCPTTASIKSVGVSSTYHEPEKGTWIGVEWKNKFNTDFEWTFGIGEFDSDDGDVGKILEQANKAISRLSTASEPMQGRDEKGQPAWVCYYQGSHGIYGMAITPAVSPQFALKTMRSIAK